MPSDRLKPPDNFPGYFQLPMARGLGKWWLLSSEDKQPCLALARKYRASQVHSAISPASAQFRYD
jgi:hypothetical protein